MSQSAHGQLLTDGMFSFPKAAGSPGSRSPPLLATTLPWGVTTSKCINVCVCAVSPLSR